MIRINLLPYREKEKKENLQRQIIILSGSLVFFLLILVSVHLYFSMSISGMEKKIREADARLVVLNKKVGDIEGFKRDKRELEQKLGVINSLESNRLFPVRMLDELNLLVPAKEVWLERISETGQELAHRGSGQGQRRRGPLHEEPGKGRIYPVRRSGGLQRKRAWPA